MTLYLITPPTADVVTLSEAKKHLRQSSDDYDDLIRALIKSAVNQIDPGGGGWLGRALRPQTWEQRSDGFPCAMAGYPYRERQIYAIELRYPPLISVDSVTYDDGDGVATALLEGTGYRVIGLGSKEKACVAPIYSGSWPSTRGDVESVRVRFTSGYGTSPDLLPAPIKQAVLLAIRDLWSLGERNLYLRSESAPGLASYEWTVSENAGIVIRAAAENLLSTYRVYE